MVLASIAMAGLLATSTTMMAHRRCQRGVVDHAPAAVAYTYSGIGVVIAVSGAHAVVRDVLEGAPATGFLVPGTRIVAVDGRSFESGTAQDWADAIRGESGTRVALDVLYPCGGQRTVLIERAVMRVDF